MRAARYSAALVTSLAIGAQTITLAGAGATSSVDPSTVPDGPVAADDRGIAPSKRDEVLGDRWDRDGDEANVVLNGPEGLAVLTARSSDGYAWDVTATLPVPWADTDLWISNSCVTSSGDHMAVVYAPRAATNNEDAFGGGANAAIVDLRSGAVRDLGTGYTISYFNPGCGTDDTVTITRFEPGFGTTRIAVVDATSGEVTTTSDVEGLATSAVSRADGTILAVSGSDLVSISPNAKRPEVLVKSSGTVYDLTVDDNDRLAYVSMERDLKTATAHVKDLKRSAPPKTLGTGPVTQLGVQAARDGGFFLTGQDVRGNLKGISGVTLVPEAAPHAVISSTGALVVEEVKPTGITEVESAGAPQTTPEVVTGTKAEITATVVDTGATVAFNLEEVELDASSSEALPTEGLTPVTPTDGASDSARKSGAGADPDMAASSAAAADPHDPVESERYCAVPRNDPNNQAYQPKPRQVEWAVDRAVKGQLTETRPANWRNLGMPAYSPQGLFPRVSLVGGGTIPPQIVLGVLTQESNLWQASRYTAPGNTGNPLIGDFYGSRGSSIWDIDFAGADCGYGVGQITDGMRLAGHERTDASGRPIETALPYQQQRAIALDYTANIAMSVRMLAQKWNELANAGLLVNDGNASYIENWFFAVWAYNSGFHPKTDATSPWGVGWFNNPINTIYSPTRTPFLEASQADAARPQDWPYPEKIIGFASYGTSLVETQYADPEKRTYTSQWVSSFRTAWWNGNDFRSLAKPPIGTFCNLEVNDCDPSKAQPCQLSSYECWWHEPAAWKSSVDCDLQCGHGFERFGSSYATEASSMAPSLPALTLQSSHLPNCEAPPSGTVVVDDTRHLGARNSGECAHKSTAGAFEFTFGAGPDGSYPAKVDLHQQGGGFNAHFYFAHMRDRSDLHAKVTGTWKRGADMSGTWTRVWVHLPDYAAWTQQAAYTIDMGDGTSQTRYLPQRRYANEWVSLGVFQMRGDPSVSLSNVLVDENTTDRYKSKGSSKPGPDINGYDDIAWDAVGFQPLAEKPDDFVVALGDSYASGEGADDYEPWSDNNGNSLIARNACHQSANAWIRKTTLPGESTPIGEQADRADVGLDFHFLACSGAQTEHLLPYHTASGTAPLNAEGQNGSYGQAGMVSQLDAGYLDENTTLVTLSIGGNDMRFSEVIKTCVIAYYLISADCSDDVLDGDTEPAVMAGAARLENELPASLATVLQKIQERAPNARIALFGYPKLFESGTTCLPVHSMNQEWLNEFADSLNTTLQGIAEQANRSGEPGVFFVNPQTRFSGHNLCTGQESGINGLQFGVTPGENRLVPWLAINGSGASQTSVHPNQLGTSLYAEALEDALASHS